MALTRKDAKLVAEELLKLLHGNKDFQTATEEIIKTATTQFICTKDAARLIGISPGRLYQTKDLYGCYSKVNGRLRFDKIRLTQAIMSGSI